MAKHSLLGLNVGIRKDPGFCPENSRQSAAVLGIWKKQRISVPSLPSSQQGKNPIHSYSVSSMDTVMKSGH